MSFPDYFLADLPPEASLDEGMIREACLTLQRNRQRYLADRTSEQLISTLAELAAQWLNPTYRFRQLALEKGPTATGFSPPVLAKGLDNLFSQITSTTLRDLLRQELGHEQRLDRFSGQTHPNCSSALALARGPVLQVHITAGNIPDPTLISIVLGLLVRSAQFVKCASGTSLLPRLFAHSLYEADAKLASCLELAEWPGGRTSLEKALFEQADCVTATGKDATLREVRRRLPDRIRFLGYGHRVSFAYLTRESVSDRVTHNPVPRAVDDIVAWDQLGCLSPHLFYVEEGGSISAEQFAQQLAEELKRREAIEPRGPLPADQSALLRMKRDFYQIRADHSNETRLWSSQDSTAWTVIYERDPIFQVSCLHRFAYVKPAQTLAEVLQAAELVRHQVSTVGLAAPPGRAESLALALAQWGVPRICPLGQMQKPPLTWRHDGRPTLGDLIQWTDYEGADYAR